MNEVPIGTDGRPMTKISASVTDKVPTVQYGSAHVGPVTIERYIDDLGDGPEGRQHRIDRGRELLKDAEYVAGVERRILQWAIDPASKIQNPVTGADAFAAPPAGYDKNQLGDPRDSPLGAPVVDQQASPPSMAQSHDQPSAAEQAEHDGSPIPPAATTTIPGDGGTPTA